MILNVAICDDEEKDITVINKYLEHFEMDNDIDFNIYLFRGGSELLEHYSKSGDFHIVFLDIEMPGENGLTIANHIRNDINDNYVKIVFVSNYPEFMQDSFNVQAFHFFPKPFKIDSFLLLMKQILSSIEKDSFVALLVNEGQTEELVNINDIVMVHIKDSINKETIVTLTSKTILARERLTELYDKLKNYGFTAPSRGYLINMRHVHFINDTSIVMDNHFTIPLSRRKRKEIKKMFHNNLLLFTGNR